MFDAIFIEKNDDKQTVSLKPISENLLPEGDVLVDVAFSSLNFKDALAMTGASPVVRSFPMVPGIDFSAIVRESSNPEFKAGDRVVLNGWGVGEKHWGGLAKKARVKGDWLISLPDGISMKAAMQVGTAGYTAMLCVLALEKQGITPDMGEVVVTGASGGVGSVAVSLLAGRGFNVTAVTGRMSEEAFLKGLGATTVIDRAELTGKSRPLSKERWVAAIDVAGGVVLANLLSMIKYRGVVACCGLAASMDLPTTVAPFILRGVTLAGVDSVMCPKEERIKAWKTLAQELDTAKLDALSVEVPFADVIDVAPKFLEGKVRGRIVVPVAPELA